MVKKGQDRDDARNPLEPCFVRAKEKYLFHGVSGSWFLTNLCAARQENDNNNGMCFSSLAILSNIFSVGSSKRSLTRFCISYRDDFIDDESLSYKIILSDDENACKSQSTSKECVVSETFLEFSPIYSFGKYKTTKWVKKLSVAICSRLAQLELQQTIDWKLQRTEAH